MHLHETILCSTAPPTSSSAHALGQGSLSVYDIQNGSCLASFKQTSAHARSVAHVETSQGVGGVMFAAQPDKAVLNVYSFQKDQVALKIVLPEKLSCVAVDLRGGYFAGGTAQGRIYLWEVASGIMFNVWDAHYRSVNVLRFTECGSALLSGSEDSAVSVWSLSRLLDNVTQDELLTAYCTLSDHTLPITDIHCGVSAFPRCRVFTSSLDHSVKLWDLASRTLLTTFHFPAPIAHLTVDPTERVFFAASAGTVTRQGEIYQVNLFQPRRGLPGHEADMEMEAVGGRGAGDIVRIEPGEGTARRKRVIDVGAQVTALALSLTSALLLAGTAQAKIHLYDVPSHQLLRTIALGAAAAPAGAPSMQITYLRTMLRPADLVGHVSLSLGASGGAAGGGSGAGPAGGEGVVRPVAVFQRVRDRKARERHEVAVILPGSGLPPPSDEYGYDEMLRDQAFFVHGPPGNAVATNGGGGAGAGMLQGRVSELEAEVERLREQLGRAKGVNDAMWETVVRKVVKGAAVNGEMDEAEGEEKDEGRKKKRGRV